MNAQKQRKNVLPTEPELGLEPASSPSPAPAAPIVRVVSGAFDESLEVAGMTVAAVHQMLAPDLGGEGTAHALVDGSAVPGSYRLRPGQTLELTPIVGEKGADR